jgi:hypothetical protein
LEFFTANTFTPILNTKEFSSVFGGKEGLSVPLNEKGFIQALECIALPGTLFQGTYTEYEYVIEVKSKEYPYKGPFFVDRRFLSASKTQRIINLPSSLDILHTLKSLLGAPYLWGGNCPGIPEMLSFYPPKGNLKKQEFDTWLLKGFDCSGLIYYATNGYTPRNTSSWDCFGKGVQIYGKNLKAIVSCLKPLDAIVWNGHILFVYDEKTSIESTAGEGVVLKDLEKRIESLLNEKKQPMNSSPKDNSPYFLIKRWHHI